MNRALPARTPWTGGVILLALLLAPAVAYGGPLGFAILPSAGALLLWPLWRRPRAPQPVLLILLALWIWAAASYAWSPAPRDAGDVETLTGLKLLLVLGTAGVFTAAAGALSGRAARRALWALGGVTAVYALLITAEGFASDPPLYRWFTRTLAEPVRPDIARIHLGQGTVLLPLLIWPLALVLRRTRPGAVALIPIAVAAVAAPLLLNQQSALLALVAGGGVFALGVRFGPVALRAVGAVAAAVQLGAPWVVSALDRAGALAGLKALAPASTDARLDIWALVSERVMMHPLRGWGLDASRLLPPPVSLHPHNGPLQIWLELGAHGAILAALIWWAVFDLCARAAAVDRTGGAAAAGCACAYFVIGALSFGVWQEWWLGLGAVTAAVCVAVLVQRRWERLGAAPPSERLRPNELQPL